MSEDTERHAMKMAKKKAARDKIMATKTEQKGLIIVHTGKGKGKSSAAFVSRTGCPAPWCSSSRAG
jgi:cob(I)alamin adenosyltransferase